MAQAEHSDAMVVIAIVVSRVEAVVLVSMLEAAGVMVHAGAIHHASVEVNSLALGGHRIWVPASQYELASAVLRESGADTDWQFSKGLQRAVVRLLALWIALYGSMVALGVLAGAFTAWWLLGVPLSGLTVPVNPQGRGDFFLAER